MTAGGNPKNRNPEPRVPGFALKICSLHLFRLGLWAHSTLHVEQGEGGAHLLVFGGYGSKHVAADATGRLSAVTRVKLAATSGSPAEYSALAVATKAEAKG